MVYTLIDHNFRPISAREITQLMFTMKNDHNVGDDDHIAIWALDRGVICVIFQAFLVQHRDADESVGK